MEAVINGKVYDVSVTGDFNYLRDYVEPEYHLADPSVSLAVLREGVPMEYIYNDKAKAEIIDKSPLAGKVLTDYLMAEVRLYRGWTWYAFITFSAEDGHLEHYVLYKNVK